MLKDFFAIAALLVLSVSAKAATTYTYNGPTFAGSRNHVSVRFTTSAPLGPSTSYLDPTSAGVTASSISVSHLGSFTLPVTTFQVHTDAAGAIDSWFIFGDLNTLMGNSPTMTGTDWQAYTINTRVFIPGSDIGGIGLVTGHYDYDQATKTSFYASCSGAPAGCTLAGNDQPYVGNYGGIINPSNTSGSAPWWNVTTNTAAPSRARCKPAGADFADIAALRTNVAANCPCTAFDNTSATTTRKAYLACVAAQLKSAALKPACVATGRKIFQRSICGYTPGTKTICLRHWLRGKVTCAVKVAGACDAESSKIQKECQQPVCLDAADSNGNQVIDASDDCAPASGVCGDGILSAGEECDEGTSVCIGGTDAGAPCATNAVCDSGVCSEHGNRDDVPDQCRSNCQEPSCGDGVVDTGEQCDDGNTTSGDGCSSTCIIEPAAGAGSLP